MTSCTSRVATSAGVLDRSGGVWFTPDMVSIQTGPSRRLRAARARCSVVRVVAVPGALAACSPRRTRPPSGLSSGSGRHDQGVPRRLEVRHRHLQPAHHRDHRGRRGAVADLRHAAGLRPRPQARAGARDRVEPDGDAITYTLRDGVTWHDGTPFTAEDVVFTFDTIAKNTLGVNSQYLTELVRRGPGRQDRGAHVQEAAGVRPGPDRADPAQAHLVEDDPRPDGQVPQREPGRHRSVHVQGPQAGPGRVGRPQRRVVGHQARRRHGQLDRLHQRRRPGAGAEDRRRRHGPAGAARPCSAASRATRA